MTITLAQSSTQTGEYCRTFSQIFLVIDDMKYIDFYRQMVHYIRRFCGAAVIHDDDW
jgi:hypothetical protein